MKVKSLIQSPLGPLNISASDKGITNISFGTIENNNSSINTNKNLANVITQLNEYFAGKRQKFDLPLDLQGTDFQKKIWQELLKIPHGKTVTYGYIANLVDKPKAARAVGMACNKNPLIILIPCHRIIGTNGSLTGYAGGLEKKQWLVEHEKGKGV